jgi:hypothetical protein
MLVVLWRRLFLVVLLPYLKSRLLVDCLGIGWLASAAASTTSVVSASSSAMAAAPAPASSPSLAISTVAESLGLWWVVVSHVRDRRLVPVLLRRGWMGLDHLWGEARWWLPVPLWGWDFHLWSMIYRYFLVGGSGFVSFRGVGVAMVRPAV